MHGRDISEPGTVPLADPACDNERLSAKPAPLNLPVAQNCSANLHDVITNYLHVQHAMDS